MSQPAAHYAYGSVVEGYMDQLYCSYISSYVYAYILLCDVCCTCAWWPHSSSGANHSYHTMNILQSQPYVQLQGRAGICLFPDRLKGSILECVSKNVRNSLATKTFQKLSKAQLAVVSSGL